MIAYPIRELEEDIAHSFSPDEFDRAAHAALTFFDALNAEIIAQRKVKLACCEGCASVARFASMSSRTKCF